ncbi:type I restriction enzyme S subunit [Bradyrhizobium sp. LB7.1]
MRNEIVSSEWFRMPIGQLAKIQSGGTPDRGIPAYWDGGTIPWATTSEVNYREIHGTRQLITNEGLKNSSARLFPPGTLLIALYGQGKTRGQVGRLAIAAATNQACAAILPDDRLSVDYLYYFLEYSYGRIRGLSNMGSQENLSAALIGEFVIEFPDREEQRRIVEIIRAWDEAIAKLDRLIDVKEVQLRGLLANCAVDAREKSPPEGWEKTTIGDVATLVQSRVTWDEDANYKLITVKRGCGGLVFRGDRVGRDILTKDMYSVRAGDFLISKRQVVHGAWALVSQEFDGGHVSKEYACLRAKPRKLWMPYFAWLSRTDRLQHEAFICSYGVDIEKMVLNLDWLLQTPLLLPRSIDTQKRMAAGLDCLHREIQLLKQQLGGLQKQKRGLMQRILTGEWRVPTRDGDRPTTATRRAAGAAQ